MFRKGFTLLEVMISVFIIGILIGLASFSFVRQIPKYQLLRAVRELHSRMNQARYQAIFSGTKVRIHFDQNGYRLESYHQDRKEWVCGPKNILEGISLEANNSPTFHPQGTVSNLATIHLYNSWGAYKITLAISGRIKAIRE